MLRICCTPWGCLNLYPWSHAIRKAPQCGVVRGCRGKWGGGIVWEKIRSKAAWRPAERLSRLGVSQHVLLDLSNHQAAAEHLVDGEVGQGRVAEPHRAVGQARPLRHQVEQVVACLGILGAAKVEKNTFQIYFKLFWKLVNENKSLRMKLFSVSTCSLVIFLKGILIVGPRPLL